MKDIVVNEQKKVLKVLYDKLKHSYKDLKHLNAINKKITSKLNADDIIRTVYKNINDLMDASGFGIGLFNETRDIICFSNYIEKNEVLPYDEAPLSDKNSLSTWCFTNQKEVYISDYDIETSRYVPEVSLTNHGEIPKSLIYLPLTTNSKKIGVITVQSFEKYAYTEYHLNLLRNIAIYTSIALENAEAYKEIETLSLVASKTINYVLIVNKNDEIEWVNEGFINLTGFSLEEAKGQKPSNVIGGEYTEWETIEDINNAIFELKQDYKGEITNYKKNGEIFKAAIDITPILDKQGNLIRYFIIGSDITDKINYQSEIKRQRDLALLKQKVLADTISKLEESDRIIRKKNQELHQLSHVVSNIDNAVMIILPNGDIEWVNEGFTKLYGWTFEEYKKNHSNIFDTNTNKKIIRTLKKAIIYKRSLSYDVEMIKKSGEEVWIRTTWTPVLDDTGKLMKLIGIDVDMSRQKSAEEKLKHINNVMLNKSKLIKDSIRNAKRIQHAILPSEDLMNKNFKETFILYKPKEIISGDFYWYESYKDKIFFAVADCTGHGVPGALLSVLCSKAVTKTVKEYKIHTPSLILDKTAELLSESFSQSDDDIKDGMDIALCCLHTKTNELEFAGANSPLYIISDNVLDEIKPDNQPIGYYPKRKPFTNQRIQLKEGDSLYIFSDGYADQFGGENNKKFYYQPFRELFLKNNQKPMSEQKKIFDDVLNKWKGQNDQIDDICIFGARIR